MKFFKINKNIFWLSIASFLNDLSSEMIIPILPLFLKSLGAGSIAIGFVGGARDGLANILKFFGGYLSDKIGKKKIFLFWGYSISNIFKLLLAFSSSWTSALICSTSERIGKGIRTAPSDSIISQSMPNQRGKGFGFHRAFDTAGAIFGSLCALLLFWIWGLSFKFIIFIAAMISFLSLIPLKFVSEPEVEKRPANFKFFVNLSKELKLFIFISTVFAFANFSYMFFILKAQTFLISTGIVSEQLSFAIVMLLYVLYNVFYSFFAYPLGIFADKIGQKKILIWGYLIFSLTALLTIIAKSIIAFVLVFVLYGIFCAIVNSNQRAMVSNLASKGSQASALGLFHTIVGLATLAGSVFAGVLWSFSPQIPFVFATIVSLFAAILLSFLKV
ncbi:TPA: MFS transporter [Candidatus Dependentiae bacterium]|nr:MAG: Major facilitator superfamily [candidate division TM6 bacterium GW2011_GWE2_31_21]KKP54080.1 MAG: Major facilitator superfamily [candidate division TM6 bacterium GW2011_GWF2_33_332]HBS48338.1 MFS transporter [Candidatus Dependentiae bacterium]HBZ72988.1 MFS transporter [Candidatus Dependentiae bacterium]